MDHSGGNHRISAFCQSCGAAHVFDVIAVGKRARCNTCGFVFRVPALSGQTVPDTASVQSITDITDTDTVQDPVEPPPPAAPSPAQSPLHVDPLTELAASEVSHHPEESAGSAAATPEAATSPVITQPEVDPRATVTAVTFMLGLLYLAMIAICLILLHHFLGTFLTIWLLLPVVVVFGRHTLVHIAFLMTGKASR